MGLKRTTPPAADPVTLAEAKQHLREDLADPANDAYISAIISAAHAACSDITQRTLMTSGWTLTLDGFPDAIELTRPPLIGVASVRFIDPDGVQRTLDPADYLVDNANSEVGYIVPGVNKAWPPTQERINAVEVQYTAGYGETGASVPAPMRHWILLAVGDMYAMRERSADRPAVTQGFADQMLDVYKIRAM
jgi:uncharacterized phiE125 gp8 family phage protein